MASDEPGTAFALDRLETTGADPAIAWIDDPASLTTAFVEEWHTLGIEAAGPNPFFEEWNLRPALAHLAAMSLFSPIARRGSWLACYP